MADNLTYYIALSDAQRKEFTMPAGFEENVEIHCWGAGGGTALGQSVSVATTTPARTVFVSAFGTRPPNAQYVSGGMGYPGNPLGGYYTVPGTATTTTTSYPGQPGGGGGYASTVVAIAAGSKVQLQVGQPGANGGIGNRPRSLGGTAPSYTAYRGGSAGSSYDEDADMGSGGGGGGASVVLVNDSPVCVGAGGGGAGGAGDDVGSTSPGYPGGVFPGQASNIYAVSLGSPWSSFLNTYGVWGGGQDYSVSLNFPVSGSYTFNFSVDNYGSISLDGTPIITRTGENNYQNMYSTTASVTAGTHTVRVLGYNISGPAGVGAQILKPDTSELWNTRSLTVTTGLTDSSDGGSSADAWASGGGGGGGYLGGQAGVSYGDDNGSAPAGNGGMNYGNTTEAGSGINPGGLSVIYYPSNLSKIGYAGYPGYIILKLTKKPGLKIKNPDGSGNWVDITNSYVRTEAPRPGGQSVTATYSTIGTTEFKVPAQITSLTVSYLTGTGLKTEIIPVVPNSVLPVTIGNYGEPSSIGDYSMPAFSKNVFQFSGNIDDLDDTNFSVATASGASYSGTGTSGQLTAGASAAGVYYAETNERYHGDLTASISINTLPTGLLLNNFRAYVVSYSGRHGGDFLQQPTQANNYIAIFRIYDPSGSEGSYNYTIGLQQQGYFTVTYTYPAVISGWKEIQNIYVKVNGAWSSVNQSTGINLSNY